MDLVEHANQVALNEHHVSLKRQQELLLSYLYELQHIEARLWGVIVKELKNGEEVVLEDANHLIYLSKHDIDEIEEFLKNKEVRDFLNDLKELREDFVYLKRKIREKDKLKTLVNSYTLKLVSKKSYPRLEEVFLLEKQLNQVLEVQDQELMQLIVDISYLHGSPEHIKIEGFIDGLKRIRQTLSGHLEHHELWERERMEYSNSSNIIHALIVRVKESL